MTIIAWHIWERYICTPTSERQIYIKNINISVEIIQINHVKHEKVYIVLKK